MRIRTARLICFLFGVIFFALSGGLVAAEADGPDYWAVQGVSSTDVLNLRKGPSIQFPIIARIPSDYAHLENLGCSPPFTTEEWSSFSERERNLAISLRWCRVKYEGHAGWVKGTYLREGVTPKE